MGAVDDYELLDVGEGMRLERFGVADRRPAASGGDGPRGEPGRVATTPR